MSTTHPSAATVVAPVLTALVGPRLPVRFEFWDRSTAGPDDAPATVRVASPEAIRHLAWAPGELGLARAFVGGHLDIQGDIVAGITALRGTGPAGPVDAARLLPTLVRAARQLGIPARRPERPAIEATPHGFVHSRHRDVGAVSHHYDVGDDFYRLVLGRAMTYSCARFADPDTSLEQAQASKHELVCRKLGLTERPDLRLLDIGCGWGAMAMHAARVHGARVVGITLSRNQAAWATEAVARAGLADRVEIRHADYRELAGERFDAISSIGMFEHVGSARADEYFAIVERALVPGGRFLNHAISSVGGSRLGRRSFMYRYVFPDGELLDVGDTVQRMERAGLEVRDVESLREHYAATLRAWIANLDANWASAVDLAGEARARVWRLYMAASVVGFEDGGINVHQVLGVLPDPAGRSGMPRTRDGWSTAAFDHDWQRHEHLVGAVT